MLKITTRILIKILGTPFIVPAIVLLMLIGQFTRLADWIYDSDEVGRKVTHDMNKEFATDLRNWFTTI